MRLHEQPPGIRSTAVPIAEVAAPSSRLARGGSPLSSSTRGVTRDGSLPWAAAQSDAGAAFQRM